MRPFVLSLSFIVALYLLCAEGVAADDATTKKTQTFARSELDVELPVSTSLSIFKPKDFTAEKSYPLVVYLHGFCLGDDAQQLYSVYRCALLAWWWRREKANADANWRARANHFRSVSLHAFGRAAQDENLRVVQYRF